LPAGDRYLWVGRGDFCPEAMWVSPLETFLMSLIATALDLYRAGNRSGPRFDHFVPGEITIEARNGVNWVLGPKQGGASTKETPMGLRGTWYRLPDGTIYNNSVLFLWNDYADHWSWEPAQDMQLDAYLDALRALSAKFVRV
jgi:hypothetical protein